MTKNFTKPIAAENEILKASDVTYGYDALVDNIMVAMRSILSGGENSFVVGGKVKPFASGGLNVSITPIFAYEKGSGKCVAETGRVEPVSFEEADSTLDRIDIVEVGIKEEEFDIQTRAMNDPSTGTKSYVEMATKKRVVPEVKVKKGSNGSPHAPQVDEGFVKIAEVVIPAGTLNIDENHIKNITARKGDEENMGWTANLNASFNPGYLAEIYYNFLVSHNEEGKHKERTIDAKAIDFGVETGKVKGSLIPSGQSMSIHNQNFTSQTDITTLLSVLAENMNEIYPLANSVLGRFSPLGDIPVACSTENINIVIGGEKTIDGITCTVGQMVFLKDQTNPVENGFWEVQTGAWNRYEGYTATDGNPFIDKLVAVENGIENAGRIFYLEDNAAEIGKDALCFKLTFLSASPHGNTVAMRDSEGRMKAAEPKTENDVVIKKNLDKEKEARISYDKAITAHGDSIDGRNLLDVLGVESVADAFKALHEKCDNGDFTELMLGDYIDLSEITVDGTKYTHVANYQNLRIVIAGFNFYKGAGDTENSKNHILWVFRNIVLKRQMNASDTNAGGYGASAMKQFLDGVFATGLGEEIGAQYLYTVRRAISKKGSTEWLSCTVFLPTTVEVFGVDTYGDDQNAWNTNTQIPLYRSGSFYRCKKYNGSRHWWWLGTPLASNATSFCYVYYYGYSNSYDASNSGGGVAPAFCTC